MLNASIIIITILLGFWAKYMFRSILTNSDNRILDYLWCYHIVITFIYIAYVISNGGDALGYWNNVKILSSNNFLDFLKIGIGTNYINVINYFPSRVLDLSFYTGSMLYSLFGYIGLLLFYLIFKQRIEFNSRLFRIRLFPFVLFLPNLHFWSAGIGKDSILFFCIALFFYSIQQPKKYIWWIIFTILLSYSIRPHITLFLLTAFGIGSILDGKLKIYQKWLFLTLMVGGLLLFFESAILYLKIEDLDMSTLNDFAVDKVSKLSRSYSESAVDLSNYYFPFKVLTFLYRPFFFDINGILGVIASFENLLLFILSIKLLRLNLFRYFLNSDYIFKTMFIFFLIGTISFSMILGNLGIMLRQKNMFIPCLLFICLWSFSKKYEIDRDNLATKNNLKQ